MCLGPCFFILAVVLLGVFSSLAKFGLRTAIVAFIAIPLSLALGIGGDSSARDLIFRFNYRRYKEIARGYVAMPTPKLKQHDIEPNRLRGFGIYSARCSWGSGSLQIRFHTASGPSLETTLYSKTPLAAGPKIEFKHRDELGYWYFED